MCVLLLLLLLSVLIYRTLDALPQTARTLPPAPSLRRAPSAHPLSSTHSRLPRFCDPELVISRTLRKCPGQHATPRISAHPEHPCARIIMIPYPPYVPPSPASSPPPAVTSFRPPAHYLRRRPGTVDAGVQTDPLLPPSTSCPTAAGTRPVAPVPAAPRLSTSTASCPATCVCAAGSTCSPPCSARRYRLIETGIPSRIPSFPTEILDSESDPPTPRAPRAPQALAFPASRGPFSVSSPPCTLPTEAFPRVTMLPLLA